MAARLAPALLVPELLARLPFVLRALFGLGVRLAPFELRLLFVPELLLLPFEVLFAPGLLLVPFEARLVFALDARLAAAVGRALL